MILARTNKLELDLGENLDGLLFGHMNLSLSISYFPTPQDGP